MKYIVIYGIACVKEIGDRKEVISEIPAITSEEKEIVRLVELCNKHKLSPCHLNDVVDDMLASAAY